MEKNVTQINDGITINTDVSVIQKYSYLLYWIYDDQRFEICKNL